MAHLKHCLNCGKEVKISNHRLDTFKFCSRSCGALYIREQHTTDCIVCGNSFTHISARANKAKYCSRSCYHKAQSKKGKTEFECQHCHKKFNASKSTNRKFCSKECVNKSSKLIWKPTFKTARKALLARGKINSCEKCGYSDHPEILGVHHKDKNRKNNDLNNLIVLCPNCHSLEHSQHIVH